jgi:hypothetical protein
MANTLTYQHQYRPARSSNSTDASFPSRVATATQPTGEGVLDLFGLGGGQRVQAVKVVPFGSDAANETFKVRVLGWTQTSGSSLWVPSALTELTCTLATPTGVSGHDVADTDFFCDAITIDVGTAAQGVRKVEPVADSMAAYVILQVEGHDLIELIFDRNASAASANALVQGL